MKEDNLIELTSKINIHMHDILPQDTAYIKAHLPRYENKNNLLEMRSNLGWVTFALLCVMQKVLKIRTH